jgi:hypothetical protein
LELANEDPNRAEKGEETPMLNIIINILAHAGEWQWLGEWQWF